MFPTFSILLTLLAAPAAPARAQDQAVPEAPGIQDNSFLIEEAYNQDPGVVQHINTFTRSFESHDWAYTFTQEWPLGGQRHQLSYTVLVEDLSRRVVALGDLTLNYRYQLLGSGESRVACAPRLSLLLPVGDARKGYGSGGIGLQTNLALSWAARPQLDLHFNAGATLVPRAEDEAGDRARSVAVNLGQSLIWKPSKRVNLMLETLFTRAQAVVGSGATEPQKALLVSPGLRWAYDFASGLQIVPGLAVPIGVGPSRGERALLLYLSFEHPFKKTGHS